MDWVNIATRWLHVTAAVAGVGGIFFMYAVVLPVLRETPDSGAVGDAIRRRYKRIAHAAIGLLLLTGLYNYLMVATPRLRGLDIRPLYHPVMGVKILLALILFGISFALLKPVPAVHERRAMWLGVNVVLALIILALGAYLRRLWS